MHTICYMILSCEFIQQLIYHHIKIKSHEHSLVTNFFPKSLLSKTQYQPMHKASQLPLGRCRTLLWIPQKNLIIFYQQLSASLFSTFSFCHLQMYSVTILWFYFFVSSDYFSMEMLNSAQSRSDLRDIPEAQKFHLLKISHLCSQI